MTAPEPPRPSESGSSGAADTRPSLLVVYASKHGATAEIAERLGARLRHTRIRVDVVPASDDPDPAPYDAVVVGSAVYVGRWRRDAARYLRRHERALAERPTWLFSSGPTGEGDPAELLGGWTFPRDLETAKERIGPRGNALFHGVLDADGLGPVERWMISAVGAPRGDFREEGEIDRFASGVAREVHASAAGGAG